MFGLDDMAAATLIGSGVNFLGGLFSNSSNADTNKENREWQSHENELSRKFQQGENSLDRGMQNYWNQRSLDWQEKMWNLQNQYNTPSAMMARYKEAGLNPYLNGLSQMGSGAGAAGAAGSPSIGTSPAGSSAPLSGSPSSIPMVAPHLDLAGALGVSSSIANQNADTLRKKWDIYNSILENGDRQTAKRFLAANPDMMSDADPENSLYYKRWKRSDAQMQVENEIRSTENWLLSRYGGQEHEKALAEADARIENIVSQMNERDANIALLTEQLNTELEKQFNLRAQGTESYAHAETLNALRKWEVNSLVLQSGLAGLAFSREKATFDSESELRAWLNSDEGKEAIKELERKGIVTNPAVWVRYIYQFLDHLPFAAGANVSRTTSHTTVTK